MSEHAPITGELRVMMDTLGWYDEDGNIVFTTGGTPASEIACLAINSKTFGALCDAIDAVHAGLERENAELRAKLDNSADSMHETDAWQLGYDEGFANADDWMADNEDAMAEHGWYRALDADKKPMLLGDRMEWANGTFTIHELKFTEGGCTTWDSEHGYTVNADECHHHAPTVEDVLTEMVAKLIERGELTNGAAQTISEYAAKLRLAGDAE